MNQNIQNILRDLNPWWHAAPIEEEKYPRRQYYANLESLVLKGEPTEITVLKGLRRTGKTVMLKQLIATAIAKNIYDRKQIVFLTGMNSAFKGKTILQLASEINSDFAQKEDWLLIVDEVQLFNEWRRDLLYIAEYLPRVRCAVSGSSARSLNQLEHEDVKTGRCRTLELQLPPLLFCEYLHFTNSWPDQISNVNFSSIIDARLDERALIKLNQAFVNYINFGSFPELAYAHHEKLSEIEQFERDSKNIADDIITYIDKDLAHHIGIKNKEMIHHLCKSLIINAANVYARDKHMERFKADGDDLADSLKFMEELGFIRTLNKINGNRKILEYEASECKFILENCSMPSLVFQSINLHGLGNGQRVENAVLSQLAPAVGLEKHGYVTYEKPRQGDFEIDLCHLDSQDWPLMLAEVKWSDRNSDLEETDTKMSFLMKQWGGKKKKDPKLYCTSKTLYDASTRLPSGLQIIPTAQFGIALGIDRIQNALK